MSGETGYPFNLQPVKVPHIETKYRRIHTALPVPESLPILKMLQDNEPRSMAIDQLPIVWDRAEGYQIYDPYGNCWIDFTSGIFVANIGHGHPAIKQAILQMVEKPLLHNYYFPILQSKQLYIKSHTLTKYFLET